MIGRRERAASSLVGRLRAAVAAVVLVPTLLMPLVIASSGPASGSDAATVTTVVGAPAKEGPSLRVAVNPFALALHGDRVLVADASNAVIRSLDPVSKTFMTFAGVGGGHHRSDQPPAENLPAKQVQIGSPASLAVAADGSVYVGDTGFGGSVVRRVAPDGTVTVIAGNGTQTFSGDGGPARQAGLYGQSGLAIAPDGALWIADTYNSRVRRVAPNGVITTVVGSGERGFAGDGGPATRAALDQPKGLAFTSDGSLLIADSVNNRIRKVTPDGVISTVAGSGPSGGSTFGDGRGPNGDGGPATQALLHEPSSARPTADGGFLIADTLNHKIRRVAPDGTISTIAGGGERHYGMDDIPALETNLFAPEDVLELPDGQIVIADTRASRVRVIDTSGTIRGVAGTYFPMYSGDGGPGLQAQAAGPQRLAIAQDGDVFFLDHRDYTVLRRMEADDGTVHPVAGYAHSQDPPVDGASALTASLGHATAVEVAPDGALLVAEPTLVRRIDPASLKQQLWAGGLEAGDTGDGGPRLDARFRRIVALRALEDGTVLVVDQGSNRVRRLSPGGTVSAVAGTGTQGFSGDGRPATQAQLNWPSDVAADSAGTLYIADDGNGRLRVIGADGIMRTVAGKGLHGFTDKRIPGPALEAEIRPGSLAVLPDGRVLMTDSFGSTVLAYDRRDGYVRRLAGTGLSGFRDGPADTAMFTLPQGLAVDRDRKRLYVGDGGNHRLRAVSLVDEPAPTATPPPSPSQGPTPSQAPTPSQDPSPPGDPSPSQEPSPSEEPTATTARLAGVDRYGTAVAISEATFSGPVSDIVIVTGSNWPDALAAGPAAASVSAPVLPVLTGSIPAAVASEIARLQPRRAWIIGGPAVVGDAVVAALRSDGIGVTRVSGGDRYATAAAVAARFLPEAQGAYYASGETFVDALGGGAAAAHRGWPLLLTSRTHVPPSTPRVGSERVVLGGTAVISENVRQSLGARRVAGPDRHATAAAVARDAFGTVRTGYLATAVNFPDALAGVAAAAKDGAPLLLAHRDCVSPATRTVFGELGITRRVVLGGRGVVTDRAASLAVC